MTDPTTITRTQLADALNALGIDPTNSTTITIDWTQRNVAITRLRRDQDGHAVNHRGGPATTTTVIAIRNEP